MVSLLAQATGDVKAAHPTDLWGLVSTTGNWTFGIIADNVLCFGARQVYGH